MHIEINTTSKCNLKCTYCSEGDACGLSSAFQQHTELSAGDLIEKISGVDDNDINIYFWGGEPMMNMKLCMDVMKGLMDDRRVTFMFYTNGVYIKKYQKELLWLRDEFMKHPKRTRQPRLHIQISYDGEPINSKERLTTGGVSTKYSANVKDYFLWLKDNGISASLKPTLSGHNFKYMYEAFLDFQSVGEDYMPTPDVHSTASKEDRAEWLSDLKVSLLKIGRHILDNNMRLTTFGWFRQSRANCSAGIDVISIDLDGQSYPCHGCMYRNQSDHALGNVMKEDLNEVIKDMSAKYKSYLDDFNKNTEVWCNSCSSPFCLKCPASSYEKSAKKEKGYGTAWQDNPANTGMCSVFKTATPIINAVMAARPTGQPMAIPQTTYQFVEVEATDPRYIQERTVQKSSPNKKHVMIPAEVKSSISAKKEFVIPGE